MEGLHDCVKRQQTLESTVPIRSLVGTKIIFHFGDCLHVDLQAAFLFEDLVPTVGYIIRAVLFHFSCCAGQLTMSPCTPYQTPQRLESSRSSMLEFLYILPYFRPSFLYTSPYSYLFIKSQKSILQHFFQS